MRYEATVILFLLLGMLFGCGYRESSVPVYASSDLPQCSISARQSGKDIIIRLTVANHSREAYHLLSWNLPKSGRMTTDLFEISRDGVSVGYRGIMIKRKLSTKDYITIPSGRAFTVEISLLQGYDVQPDGMYTMKYRIYNSRFEGTGLDSLASEAITLAKH